MTPIRILTAVPICDGHDSAINTINAEFIRNGIEVIYLGYHRSAREIARAAVQEDVVAIGLSSYNGGHIEFFAEVIDQLATFNVTPKIALFGGGGGTITRDDAEVMRRYGVHRIFFAGTPLEEMVAYVKTTFAAVEQRGNAGETQSSDAGLARRLTIVENEWDPVEAPGPEGGSPREFPTRIIGITGPGGVGKTTLIDELVLRFLRQRPADRRLAILSHDPSIASSGALLGDRATMIHSQDDRVYMRSLATRGVAGGLSASTTRCLQEIVVHGKFELLFVETVGTGQEAIPFGLDRRLVGQTALIMPPDYGSRLQLHKIAMLELADIIVVNKSDLRGAPTAFAEIEYRMNPKRQTLIRTQANRHKDPGVDRLFQLTVDRG
jgi:methylmalonyl-CoA mutase cobalamin-binding domain/chain